MAIRNIHRVLALLAFLAVPCALVHAATPARAPGAAPAGRPVPQRLCLESDFNGIFELRLLEEKPKGAESAWYRSTPRHYLVFNADGTYNYVAGNKVISKRVDLDRKIRETTMGIEHKLVKKYTLEDDGVLKMFVEDRLDYTYRCFYALKDVGDTKEGDLILVGYSKANAELRKVFRHVNME